MKTIYNFLVIIEKDEDGCYVGTVPRFQGCHTQAKNMDIFFKRLKESIELCMEMELHKSGEKYI